MRHTDKGDAHFLKLSAIDRHPAIGHVFDLAAERRLPIYLVGGTVRDLLLGQDTHDLDFVVCGDGLALARHIADRLGGAFVALDQERHTGRVLLDARQYVCTQLDKSQPSPRSLYLDIASLRGDDLDDDLRGRDFTINAIAMAPVTNKEWRIIDPLDGRKDLAQRTLRMASPASFADDPVRTLRAVRMQAQFACTIEPQTRSRLLAAVPLLRHASTERVRDEWFKVLQLSGAADALRELAQLGLLHIAAPSLANLGDVSRPTPVGQGTLTQAFASVDAIEQLWAAFELGPSDRPSFLPATLLALAPQVLRRYRAPICDERTHLALLKCAALFQRTSGMTLQHTAAEIVAKQGRQWHCSKREIELLRTAVGHHTDARYLAQAPSLSRRAIYRYYRKTGEYGIDAALVALADALATREGKDLPEAWSHQAEMTAQLLEAWFEHRERVISPPLYLSGSDLIRLLGVSPGPQIGDLLHRLREEQAAGEIRTRQEAIWHVRQWASRAPGTQSADRTGTPDRHTTR